MSTSAASRPAAAFHIPSLDGIRAVAFLLVFVAHAGLDRVVPGGFGVTVFFFLSGFLITTLLRKEAAEGGTISLRQFYLRRALRILPPFYLVLGLAALCAALGLLHGGVSPRALAAQALHGANYWIIRHGYGGQPSGTGVYWSLAVEEHFYVVFPCLYLVLRRFVRERRAQAAVLLGLCALVLAWRFALVHFLHASLDRTYVGSDTRVDSILFGCALALYGNPALEPSRISEAVWKRVLLPAGLFVLLATFVYRDAAFRETFRYSLQGIALAPVFIVAMRYPTWGPFRVLNLRVMRFIGVISYSLYLVHHVVLEAIGFAPGALGVARALAALALSIGIAWIIYELVEKPCAQLRKRLGKSKAATARAPEPSRGAPAPAPVPVGARGL